MVRQTENYIIRLLILGASLLSINTYGQNCIPSVTAQTEGNEQSCNAVDFGYIISDYIDNEPTTVYEVDFGDGQVITLNHNELDPSGTTTINHTYNTISCETEEQAYTFTLTATSECSPQFPKTVTIFPVITGKPPVPSFAFDPEDGCVNEPIPFLNNSIDGFDFQCSSEATYFWDFGDGSPIVETTSKDPLNHTYGAQGAYTVTMRAVQDCGEFEFTQEIQVNGPPKPIFEIGNAGNVVTIDDCADNTFIPLDPCVPLTIPIRSISTGGGLTETWSITPAQGVGFSNGNATSDNPVETITFTEPGIYDLNLNTESNCGNENSCVRIVVSDVPTPEKINLEGLDIANCSPTELDLSATTQILNVESYQWQITGINGTADPVQPGNANTLNPEAVILEAGTYEISLTITNPCGTATATEQFEVVDFEVPIIAPAIPEICVDETIELSTAAIAGATYQWYFMGEFIENATNATYGAAEPGLYNVEVSLQQCIKISEETEVILKPTPLAEITPPEQTVFCEDEAINALLQGNEGGEAVEYQWLLDGNPIDGATEQNFTATAAGIYTLQVTERGCPAISEEVSILSVPYPELAIDVPTEIEICPQETIEINATGAEAYVWTPDVGIDTVAGANVVLSPLATTTYTLTGINAGRCEDVLQIEVTVRPQPDVALEDESVCIDAEAFQLEVETGTEGTGTWQAIGLPEGSITAEGIFDPAIAGINEEGHDVQFLFTQENGCELVFNKKVFVNPLPTVSFDAPAAVCNLTSFTPTVTSEDTPNTTYLWELNGNFFSNAREPEFAFNNPGSIETISLQITNENGCTNTFSREIEVQSEVFEPDFSFNTSSVNNCSPLEVTFENENIGSNINYSWDFGNGTASDSITPNPQIFDAGANGDTTYYITLEAETACGTYEVTDSVLVRAGVNAFFESSNDTISSNFPVTFTNLTTEEADLFTWNFGDGTDEVSTAELDSITHNFVYFGQSDTTYTITLTAENDCGTSTFTREVTVIPNVFFDTRPARGCAPLTVDFSTNLTETISTVWLWGDVPGNGIAGGNQQSYTYEEAGEYDARLIVAYDFGELDTFTTRITVFPVLEASFEVGGTFCPGEPITFTNTSPDPIGSAWNFGDSTTFNGVNPPEKVYDTPGTYEVSLTVVNPVNNCPGTFTRTIEIIPFVEPSFEIGATALCANTPVQLVNTSVSAASFRWTISDDKGESFNSLEDSPEWIFDVPGQYQINLEAFSDDNLNGCRSEITQTVIVEQPPQLDFEIVKEASCGVWFVSVNNFSTYPNNESNGTLLWQFSNGASYTGFDDIPAEEFVFNPDESNNYEITLTATTKAGCVESLTLPFSVEDCCTPVVYLPDDGRTMAFTPFNGGGNELFRLKHEFIDEYDLRVYDKWDRMVFQTNDPDEGWDGYFAGAPCPAGTYKGIVTYGGCRLGDKTEPEAKAFLFYLID